MSSTDSISLQQAIRARCHETEYPRLEFPEEAPLRQTTGDRFREAAQRFPDHPAVKDTKTMLTYRELDEQSDALASYLLQSGLEANARVGLLVNANAESILAKVALLKTGYISVYLNKSYPHQRLKEIIQACDIRCLLTETELLSQAESLVEGEAQFINLNDARQFEAGPIPLPQLEPTHPTAIGFSSGSTGVPKQMVKDHVNDMHFLQRMTASVGIHSGDRILFTMGSLLMPCLALANGACFYPADLRQDGDLVGLAKWLQKEKISILRVPVSTFRALCWSLQEDDSFPDLRLILTQGEPVYRADVEAYKEKFSDHCVLVSSLGISEFGDFCHYFVDKSTEITTPTVPGGYAFGGAEVFLKKESEDQALGEICIRGSFISEPTQQRIGGSVYNTGDLGRVDPDGCIYHEGRKDFQVKVRGNRVNILEVEAAILDLEGISHTAVVGHTDDDGNVNLVAYIESAPLNAESIRQSLSARMPDYMIPSHFSFMDTLPRTLTGKINRKSLPPPEPEQASVQNTAKEKSEELSETTQKVIQIWKEVLKRDHIQLEDHFVNIGGNSLTAMMVLSRINRVFGIRLSIRALFEAQTASSVAEVVDAQLKLEAG